MNRAISAAFSAALACMLLLGAGVARAQDLDKPLLLVATPDLQGPYAHTAMLVVPLGDKHFGFILNRATGVTLARLFPEHDVLGQPWRLSQLLCVPESGPKTALYTWM